MASDTPRRNWSREETILVLELYCRTPFGKIHQANPEIVKLAALLRRTPGAVAFKACNLASFDPQLRSRGVKGLVNASRLDGEIYAEFSGDLEALYWEAAEIRSRMDNEPIEAFLDPLKGLPPGETRERLVRQRVGQEFFRRVVLGAYGGRCCVTGLDSPELLRASHIKPWSVSDTRTERTNPQNGLSLNALHDLAFDRGLITVTTDYVVRVSRALKDADMDGPTRTWLSAYANRPIALPERFLPGRRFLEYHNDVIFLK